MHEMSDDAHFFRIIYERHCLFRPVWLQLKE